MILPIVVIFLVLVCAYLEYNKKVNMNNKVVICVICVLTLVLAFSFMEKYKADHEHLENFENMEDFDVPVVNMVSPSYDDDKEDFGEGNNDNDNNADFYKEIDEKCDDDDNGDLQKELIKTAKASQKSSDNKLKPYDEYQKTLESGKEPCWKYSQQIAECKQDKKTDEEKKACETHKDCVKVPDGLNMLNSRGVKDYINRNLKPSSNRNKKNVLKRKCDVCDKCDLEHTDCDKCDQLNSSSSTLRQSSSRKSNNPRPQQSSPLQVPPDNETQPFRQQGSQSSTLQVSSDNETQPFRQQGSQSSQNTSNSKLLSEAQAAQNAQIKNQSESLLHNFYDKLNYRKPGYSYIDPKHWSVPQKRAPVCITSNSFNPASLYDRGTPTNVLELTTAGDQAATEDFVSETNIGSILPKFEYKEVY